MLRKHTTQRTATVSIISFLGLFGVATTLLLSCTGSIQNRRYGDLYELKKNTICLKALLTGYEPGPGSGLIINSDGYCITAGHVVDHACSLHISSWDNSIARGDSASCFLRKRSTEDDVALLRVPRDFCSTLAAKQIKIVGSVSEYLEGKGVCLWTGCTGGGWVCGYVSSVVTDRRPKRIRIANNFTRVFRGTSGTPVFLLETGELVGIVTGATDIISVSDRTGQHKATIGPAIVELVPAEPIKRLIAGNPGRFQVGGNTYRPRYLEPSSEKRLYEQLDVFEAYMREIKERIMFFFERKPYVDEAIQAFLQASSFLSAMRQREEPLTEDRALATMFYIRGLETKATKRNGFEEALEYFDMALRIDSSFVEARCQIALYNIAFTGDLAEAANHLASALSHDPQNAEVVNCLAVYYLITADYDSAYSYIRKAENLLPQSDPRIPLYWGVFYDPTWNPQIQSEGRVCDLDIARDYYANSVLIEPDFVTPANNLNWTFLVQLQQDTLNLLSQETRAQLIANLRAGLDRLSVYVEWGLRDPRILETFVRSYAYLAETGSDSELSEEDCRKACWYLSLAQASMNEVLLRPTQKTAVEEGLQYGAQRCECRGTEKTIIQNTVCVESRREGREVGFGHGLVLNDKGHFIVPYHLVKDASELIISSPYHGKKCRSYAKLLLIDFLEEEDLALLELPPCLRKSVSFSDLRIIDSLSRDLQNKEIWTWTGCADGVFQPSIIHSAIPEGDVLVQCADPLAAGLSGVPVILKSTGELVGVMAGAPKIVTFIDEKTGKTRAVTIGSNRLIPAEVIKKMLRD